MKIRFIISALVILLLIIPALGQTGSKPTGKSPPSLFPLINVLERQSHSMNIYWGSLFKFPDRNAKPKSNLGAIEDFF
jgi:hypothetical protein